MRGLYDPVLGCVDSFIWDLAGGVRVWVVCSAEDRDGVSVWVIRLVFISTGVVVVVMMVDLFR